MAAFAYLLPPVTGLVAFLKGDDRARWHGLQSVALGVLLPALLYGASALSVRATQLIAVLGAAAWLGLLILTASGRDPSIPVAGPVLRRAVSFD